MNKPLVSIIMPCYNSSQTISRSIESVIKQQYENWELIIIDDHSDDDSLIQINRFLSDNKKIICYPLIANRGTARCRNIGLDHANGKYVTFLDSDDLLDNDYLLKQVRFMKDHGPIISASYRRRGLKTITDFIIPKTVDHSLLLKGNPLSCLTTMYDREVFATNRFPVEMAKCEDYVFWLQMLKQGYVAYGNTEVLATYQILKNSKSRKKIKLIKYMYRVYRRYEGMSIGKSIFYLMNWIFYGLKKYKNVK